MGRSAPAAGAGAGSAAIGAIASVAGADTVGFASAGVGAVSSDVAAAGAAGTSVVGVAGSVTAGTALCTGAISWANAGRARPEMRRRPATARSALLLRCVRSAMRTLPLTQHLLSTGAGSTDPSVRPQGAAYAEAQCRSPIKDDVYCQENAKTIEPFAQGFALFAKAYRQASSSGAANAAARLVLSSTSREASATRENTCRNSQLSSERQSSQRR